MASRVDLAGPLSAQSFPHAEGKGVLSSFVSGFQTGSKRGS